MDSTTFSMMPTIETQCRRCQIRFTITEKDQLFYQKVSPKFAEQIFAVPTPTLCPQCREQQRLLWRNERKLYNRRCDATQKEIISVHSADKPYPVYSKDAWWSDSWDSLSYGINFDLSQPFFDQYQQLLLRVPRVALYNIDNENSEYNQCTGALKDCYMLGGANRNQDCYYGNYVNDCRDCVDTSMIKNCELCYECIECEQCYNCSFCKRSNDCQDSQFLVNCYNLKHCFGCVNLTNKEYCLYNQQLTPEAYREKLQYIDLGSAEVLEKIKPLIAAHQAQFPLRYMTGSHNENVTGNGAFHCKDSLGCFDVSKLEDCNYCSWLHASKDCMDIFAWGMPAELCYYSLEIGGGAYQNLFSATCSNGKYLYYCFQCYNSSNCFGCTGLKNKSYCIFNKQYTPETYDSMVAKIIAHMQTTGEWGEFFPLSLSGFGYNETVAQELYPLTQEQAILLNCRWKEEPTIATNTTFAQLPQHTKAATEQTTKELYQCEHCHKGYRIIRQELAFYQKQNIALPKQCFTCRHQNRVNQRNPHRLRTTTCSNCTTTIDTSFPATTKQKILCENCYQQEKLS